MSQKGRVRPRGDRGPNGKNAQTAVVPEEQPGSYEQAVAWSRRAIEANRNYPHSYFWLAAALNHLGKGGRRHESRGPQRRAGPSTVWVLSNRNLLRKWPQSKPARYTAVIGMQRPVLHFRLSTRDVRRPLARLVEACWLFLRRRLPQLPQLRFENVDFQNKNPPPLTQDLSVQ
jgi:hypothetical protein